MSRRISLLVFILFIGFSGMVKAQSDTLFNQVDSKGNKQGYWKKYYPDGKLMYKGFFRDNKPSGEMRRYYESGALKVIMIFNDKKDISRSALYYENGTLAARGNYAGTAKDSTWEYYSYYDQSLKARETYANGIRTGFSFRYYPDGVVAEKLEWKNNQRDGLWEKYFQNQKLMMKGTYKEDKLNGSFYVYNDKGDLSVLGYFLDNQRHNKWIFYNDDRSVDLELTYTYGKPDKESALTDRQEEMLRMIDENQGKYEEPDETNFMQKGN